MVFSKKLFDAYLLVRMHGLTHEKAGIRLGVGRSTITKRLRRLYKLYPSLGPDKIQEPTVNWKKFVTYEDETTSDIIKRF